MAGSAGSEWLEILVRVCGGEQAERPFIGVLEVFDPEAEDEDGEPTWPSQVRVFKDRDRYRVESLDGRLLTIRSHEFTYAFHDAETPARMPNEDEASGGAHSHAIRRREPRDWRGDDFTKPAGPPRATQYLGRDAWEIELAPPRHKPSPYVMTVDAVNGMVLEEHSVMFGPLSRWLELDEQESLPEELFVWGGDFFQGFGGSYEDLPEEIRDQIDAENADRQKTLERLAIAPISIGLTATPDLHEWDDDGSFYASFDLSGMVILMRRPHSDEPWEREMRMPGLIEWGDGTWDWMLRSTEEVSAEQLEHVQRSIMAAEPPKEQ